MPLCSLNSSDSFWRHLFRSSNHRRRHRQRSSKHWIPPSAAHASGRSHPGLSNTVCSRQLSTVSFVPTHRGEVFRSIEELGLPHTAAETDGLGIAFAELINHGRVMSGDETKYLPSADLLTHYTTNTREALGEKRFPPEPIPRSLDTGGANPPLREHSTDQPESKQSRTSLETRTKKPTKQPDSGLILSSSTFVEVRKTLESDDEQDAFDAACRSACRSLF